MDITHITGYLLHSQGRDLEGTRAAPRRIIAGGSAFAFRYWNSTAHAWKFVGRREVMLSCRLGNQASGLLYQASKQCHRLPC